MSEIVVRSCVEIEASLAQVWVVIADHEYDARWRAGVDRASQAPAGPVEPGTRVTEHMRVFGRRSVREAVVRRVDPERRFTWTAVDGGAEGSRSMRPGRSGFVWVELETILRPTGLLRRFTGWLRTPAMQRASDRSAGRLEALFDELLLDSE